jgi:hypothetical protein
LELDVLGVAGKLVKYEVYLSKQKMTKFWSQVILRVYEKGMKDNTCSTILDGTSPPQSNIHVQTCSCQMENYNATLPAHMSAFEVEGRRLGTFSSTRRFCTIQANRIQYFS